MTRVDQLLVQRGLAPTRSAAQRLIERGAVRWRGPGGWAVPRKAGEDLPEDSAIELTDDAELRWVSRGGLKLEAALRHAGIDPAGRVALDVGQSTGGFTDVLLAGGARHVVGIDVGHGQLHPRLRADPRVTALEGLNARHLDARVLADAMPLAAVGQAAPRVQVAPPAGFDLVVGDLSFISLTLVLSALAPLLAPDGDLLLLVKPQFEAGRGNVGKGGIVSADPALAARIELDLRAAAASAGLRCVSFFDSPIAGGDGNRERFLHARRIETPA